MPWSATEMAIVGFFSCANGLDRNRDDATVGGELDRVVDELVDGAPEQRRPGCDRGHLARVRAR